MKKKFIKDTEKRGELTDVHLFLLSKIEKLLSKKETILDAGCGYGAITNYLLGKGYNIYGVDDSENKIIYLNQNHPGRFSIMDLTKETIPAELSSIHFDTIISTEVIEHLYAPRKFILLCKSLLGENGRLIISTPYHGYLKYLTISILGCMDSHLEALTDRGHIKFWSKKTLTKLLKEQGFKVTQFIGCSRFPYLWKSMILIAEL